MIQVMVLSKHDKSAFIDYQSLQIKAILLYISN